MGVILINNLELKAFYGFDWNSTIGLETYLAKLGKKQLKSLR